MKSLSLKNKTGRKPVHGHSSLDGKKRSSRTYNSWTSMKNRCLNPHHRSYKNYGGRGVTVCKEWLDFSVFLEDMGERPEETSLDRIDNNKGYFKENCRWATLSSQQRNKRNNLMITIGSRTEGISEWCEELKIPRYIVRNRIRRGWTSNKALFTPTRGWFKKTHNLP